MGTVQSQWCVKKRPVVEEFIKLLLRHQPRSEGGQSLRQQWACSDINRAIKSEKATTMTDGSSYLVRTSTDQ